MSNNDFKNFLMWDILIESDLNLCDQIQLTNSIFKPNIFRYETEIFEKDFYVLCYYYFDLKTNLLCVQLNPIILKKTDNSTDNFDSIIAKSDELKTAILNNKILFNYVMNLFNTQFLNLQSDQTNINTKFVYYVKKNNNFIKM